MLLSEFCSFPVASIDAQASLSSAAAAMRDRHVGALVVTRQSSTGLQAIGVVTDRDIVTSAVADGLPPAATSVGALARRPVVHIEADATGEEAARRMIDEGVRRLIVVDDAGQVKGIVSLDDLVDDLAAYAASLSRLVKEDIERERARPAAAAGSAPISAPDWLAGGRAASRTLEPDRA